MAVESGLAGDDGAVPVAAEHERGAERLFLTCFRCPPHAAYLSFLLQQFFHGKAFDDAVGRFPGLSEEEVVEQLPADDEPFHRQGLVGEAAAQRVAGEVDVGADVLRAGEDDAVDVGARQLAHLVEQAQFVEHGHALAGEGVAAGFVAREAFPIEQQGAQTLAPGVQGCGRAGRPAADDDEIVDFRGSHVDFG